MVFVYPEQKPVHLPQCKNYDEIDFVVFNEY